MECYESLNEIIRASTPDTYPIVQQLIPLVMQKLGVTLDALAAPGVSGEQSEKLGGGLHSSTFQLNVRRFWNLMYPTHPLIPPDTSQMSPIQPLIAPPIPQKALKLS
jgi:hypothetical protein